MGQRQSRSTTLAHPAALRQKRPSMAQRFAATTRLAAIGTTAQY